MRKRAWGGVIVARNEIVEVVASMLDTFEAGLVYSKTNPGISPPPGEPALTLNTEYLIFGGRVASAQSLAYFLGDRE